MHTLDAIKREMALSMTSLIVIPILFYPYDLSLHGWASSPLARHLAAHTTEAVPRSCRPGSRPLCHRRGTQPITTCASYLLTGLLLGLLLLCLDLFPDVVEDSQGLTQADPGADFQEVVPVIDIEPLAKADEDDIVAERLIGP